MAGVSQPLIRRLDQITIAALTAIAVAGVFTWWLANGGHRGALIEIENAPPLDYRFLVDLNDAEWPELAQLPGIGQALAERIVDHRTAEGNFRSINDLQNVNGIGPRKLEAMRRYLLPMVNDTQVAGEKEELDADERG